MDTPLERADVRSAHAWDGLMNCAPTGRDPRAHHDGSAACAGALLERPYDRRGRGDTPARLRHGVAINLTAREKAILEAIGLGRSNKAVARDNGVTPETIKTHLRNLFLKLDVHTRTEAYAKAAGLGLISTAYGVASGWSAEPRKVAQTTSATIASPALVTSAIREPSPSQDRRHPSPSPRPRSPCPPHTSE